MIRGFSVLAGAALTAVALAACSSSNSGTEHFASATVTGKAALANSFALTYTGPVNTTGTFSTGGPGPKPGQLRAFHTKAGTLMLKVKSVPVNKSSGNQKACTFTQKTVVDYTVDGAKSTGSFAGATGSGEVTVMFSGTGPRLKNGKCNPSNNATPIKASASFTGTGPLTLA